VASVECLVLGFGRGHLFFCIQSDFSLLTICTREHFSTFGLKVNRSTSSLMLRRISPAPTSMLAFVMLKKGLPRIKGVLVSTSMLRTKKSMGAKKSRTLTGMSPLSPPGSGPIDPLAASTWS
jgi:hypothetical protein